MCGLQTYKIYSDTIKSVQEDFMYMDIYYCPYCSEKNDVKNNFCKNCGTQNPIKKYIYKENYNLFKNINFTYNLIKSNRAEAPRAKKAFLYSAIIPGAGQYSLRFIDKSILYFSAFSAAVAFAVDASLRADRNYSNYNNAVTPQELLEYQNRTEDLNKKSKIYFSIAGAVWLVNIIDLNNDIYNKFAPMKVRLIPEEQKINIEYQRKF
ncbi:MAG TPA: zinc ribbon domain-containing protein [bacterium]|nr:zinc ribbon domain-containing protein [bacterium]